MTMTQRGTPVGDGGSAYASAASAMAGSSSPSGSLMANVSQLTPDSLMAFLEVQLQGVDSQTDGIESSMQTQSNLGTALNSLGSVLNDYPAGINSGDTGHLDTSAPGAEQPQQIRDKVDGAYDAAIAAAGGLNTSAGAQIFASKQKFDLTFGHEGNSSSYKTQYPTGANGKNTIGADDDIAAAEISNLAQDVKSAQSDTNTSSQMQMIQLQSLVSQRQSFIQLVTNMMQSLNDATKSVVSNVGH